MLIYEAFAETVYEAVVCLRNAEKHPRGNNGLHMFHVLTLIP